MTDKTEKTRQLMMESPMLSQNDFSKVINEQCNKRIRSKTEMMHTKKN